MNVPGNGGGDAGSTMVALSAPAGSPGRSGGTSLGFGAPLIYALEQDRFDLLQQSYQALFQSVYDGLVLQTRLRLLLDTLTLQIDSRGLRLDFSALDAEFDRRLATDPLGGFADLLDFNRATREMLKDSGWSGWSKLADLLANDPRQQAFRSLLAMEGGSVKGMAGFNSSGGNGNDLILGDGNADNLVGNAGDGRKGWLWSRGQRASPAVAVARTISSLAMVARIAFPATPVTMCCSGWPGTMFWPAATATTPSTAGWATTPRTARVFTARRSHADRRPPARD